MRIPHIINKNTHIAYATSDVTLALVNEIGRRLCAENLLVHEGIPTLISLCLNAIAKHFTDFPLINDLVLCADRDYLLEILPTDLPLSLVVPLIEDEVYWKHRYTVQYGVLSQHLHANWTWKCIYLENIMQELIETTVPDFNDEENMDDISTLLNPHVHRLVISQLQSWKPPLSMSPDEIPDVYPNDHINLEPIFRKLQNIEELDIVFSQKNVGENFNWNMFQIALDDIKRLGKALHHLKKLRTFSLHTSNFNDSHAQILLRDLIKVTTLEQLDISNCLIGDRGALCIAKLMMCHPTLQKLVLVNNRIGGVGGEGIGYALMQDDCCPIKHINLCLNPLGHQGVMGIFRALVRVQKLEELILSGCGFSDETSLRIGAVLQLHHNLKFFDISNNWCLPGEQTILEGLMLNSTIQWIDLRQCDISEHVLHRINRKLARNRGGNDLDLDSEDENTVQIVEKIDDEEIVGECEGEEEAGNDTITNSASTTTYNQ